MRIRGFRHALSSCVSAALLAGCGGSQPPVSASNAIPQGVAGTAALREHISKKPGTSNQDLLYIEGMCGGICIFTYPQRQYVTSISLSQYSFMCTDEAGDVFVTIPSPPSEGNGHIYEYAHGGTSPIATLDDDGFPYGCSVDPTTGNLAVANYFTPGSQYGHGNVAIYPDAQGTPTYYKDANIYWYMFCSYDSSGNLLVNGNAESSSPPFALLPKGSSSFIDVTMNESFGYGPIQWDGHEFAIGWSPAHTTPTIYEVSVSGSKGTVIGGTRLDGAIKRVEGPFLVQSDRVIAPYLPSGEDHGSGVSYVGYWDYPNGGDPKQIVKRFGGLRPDASSMVISVGRSQLLLKD